MIFSEAEYSELVRPLLIGAAQLEGELTIDEISAQLVFSFLCEPSDRLPAMLWKLVGRSALLELLIARADSAEARRTMTPEVVEQIEGELHTDFSGVWDSALERWLPRLNRSAILRGLGAFPRSGLLGKTGVVLSGSERYPNELEELGDHKPPVLWVSGDSSLLTEPKKVAVVGSRQASNYGLAVTRDLAAVAAGANVVTVSGGAFGIDAEVHRCALELGAPTIAVMAGGLAQLYPKSNLELLMRVSKAGLLLSEVPPEVTPAKWRFLMRNRLIAAFGNGTIMVEAGRTSGAMSTANHALNLGREVAIVPGAINSARSVGCHDFLNQNLGAVKILARPQQLLEIAGLGSNLDMPDTGLGQFETRALDAFGSGVLQTWEIQRLSGLTVHETQIALGSLELLGLVSRSGTGYLRN